MIECPYGCGSTFNEPEERYDDGSEEIYECDECEKDFIVTCSISVDFSASCTPENHEDDGMPRHGRIWCKHCCDIIGKSDVSKV